MKIIPLYKDEKKLIKKALQDSREAQNILFKLHAPKMLSVCRYYIKDIHQAEEVMLNGFFKVFTNLKNYKATGSFQGWIRRIMVREAISYLRQKKRVEFTTDTIENYEKPYNSTQLNIDANQIQKLIDGLPEGYKIVFVMYAIEGYKHQEISKILSISEGTSKSQLYKARKMLQKQINIKNISSYGTN